MNFQLTILKTNVAQLPSSPQIPDDSNLGRTQSQSFGQIPQMITEATNRLDYNLFFNHNQDAGLARFSKCIVSRLVHANDNKDNHKAGQKNYPILNYTQANSGPEKHHHNAMHILDDDDHQGNTQSPRNQVPDASLSTKLGDIDQTELDHTVVVLVPLEFEQTKIRNLEDSVRKHLRKALCVDGDSETEHHKLDLFCLRVVVINSEKQRDDVDELTSPLKQDFLTADKANDKEKTNRAPILGSSNSQAQRDDVWSLKGSGGPLGISQLYEGSSFTTFEQKNQMVHPYSEINYEEQTYQQDLKLKLNGNDNDNDNDNDNIADMLEELERSILLPSRPKLRVKAKVENIEFSHLEQDKSMKIYEDIKEDRKERQTKRSRNRRDLATTNHKRNDDNSGVGGDNDDDDDGSAIGSFYDVTKPKTRKPNKVSKRPQKKVRKIVNSTNEHSGSDVMGSRNNSESNEKTIRKSTEDSKNSISEEAKAESEKDFMIDNLSDNSSTSRNMAEKLDTQVKGNVGISTRPITKESKVETKKRHQHSCKRSQNKKNIFSYQHVLFDSSSDSDDKIQNDSQGVESTQAAKVNSSQSTVRFGWKKQETTQSNSQSATDPSSRFAPMSDIRAVQSQNADIFLEEIERSSKREDLKSINMKDGGDAQSPSKKQKKTMQDFLADIDDFE